MARSESVIKLPIARKAVSDFAQSKPDERTGLTNHVINAINDYIRNIPTYDDEIYKTESEVSRYLFDLLNYEIIKEREDESL